MDFSSPAGWYPDPDGGPRQRFWDGEKWTDAFAAAVPTGAADPTRTWSMAAHWSALPCVFIVLTFIGPLFVLRERGRNDVYVRDHAVPALNFNLSVLLYGALAGLVAIVALWVSLALVGLILVAWLTLVIRATIAAGRGRRYSYPLSLRFVRR